MDALVELPPLSVEALIFNMLLGTALSFLVAAYYARFGEALSNRARFARLLPVLTLITVLVISVVKASLALSLGLVGALSIVRFRTAIKDPEELLYLFLAIAIGLGLGADQRVPTLAAVLILTLVMFIIRLSAPRARRRNLYLNIQTAETESGSSFSAINGILAEHVDTVDVRRIDRRDHTLQMTYFLDCKSPEVLTDLMDELANALPDSSFSFVDQQNTPAG